MIYKLGLSLARTYYKNSGKEYDEGDIEVYAYGFETFWEPLLQFIGILLIGIFTGRMFEVIAFTIAFLSIRLNAGGYHAKTSFRCTLGVFTMVGLLIVFLNLMPVNFMFYISIFCALYSIYPIIKFAPVKDKTNPLGPNLAKIFRKRCLFVFFIGFILTMATSVYGLASATTTPLPNIISYVCVSFALGHFAASSSLFAAKIKEMKSAGNKKSCNN